MAEQGAASLNTELFFAADGMVVTPVSTGPIQPGVEGRIDAIRNRKKIKIKDNIPVIGELEFDMPIGITGQNPEYDYVNSVSDTNQAQDVYVRKVDLEGNIHHEWLYGNSQVAKGEVSATDHASKAQDKGKFFLVPDNIKKVK